jgi:hypothetical protein
MKVAIHLYNNAGVIECDRNDAIENDSAQLVLAFGARRSLSQTHAYARLRDRYPSADIVLCSTSGEIFDSVVVDESITVTVIQFEETTIRTAAVNIKDFHFDSYEAGRALVSGLVTYPDCAHLIVFSDGSLVNGSNLVRGMNQVIDNRVPITGGLAGDGLDFTTTVVGINGEPVSGGIVAIGFYGHNLLVSHGSMGGWEGFGPEMTVTRSEGNRIFAIDEVNALGLYKKYLGPYAAELPGSAMFFPLSVWMPGDENPVVRSILSIDPATESMLFAGSVPVNAKVRLMKGHFDKIIEAAAGAAGQTLTDACIPFPRWALLVSCVGRRIVLDGRIDEEIEAVKEMFPQTTLTSGFYSYGEISPYAYGDRCELHNQSMTITTFTEL